MASSSGETWKSDISGRPALPPSSGGRDLLDEPVELRGLEGLLDVSLRAHLQAADRVLFLSFGRDDDDGYGLVGRLLLDPLKELEPVHDRHVDVEQDEVDALLLPQLVQRFQPVHGADELAALVTGKEELVHLVDERRIVDGEDLPQHRPLSCRRAVLGRGLDTAARTGETERGSPEPVRVCITEGGERSMSRAGPLPGRGAVRAAYHRAGERGTRPVSCVEDPPYGPACGPRRTPHRGGSRRPGRS